MVEHNHELANEQERMQALIENISAYIEQYHGGWVKLVSYEGDTVQVSLGGACDGCPLTETTLQGWVAGTVRQFFPEVKTIKAV